MCAYFNYLHGGWADWLPTVELAANSHVSETTTVAPLYATYGFTPRFRVELPSEPPPLTAEATIDRKAADAFAEKMMGLHDQLRDEMAYAQADYEKHTFGKRAPSPAYQIGDTVWLNIKNLRTE